MRRFFLAAISGLAPAGADLVGDGVAVIAFVAQHELRVGGVLGHQVGEGTTVVNLPGVRMSAVGRSSAMVTGVDFGREVGKPPRNAAKSLV